ncbi:hypothetical protein NBRC116583_20940 [Arenicella sp. 4NH20-0111]|uniref:hypothetical protein n=1 Tax=Arenicella sp. 4NH20-0111 TaxID=3127648 RepID=UPI003101C44A
MNFSDLMNVQQLLIKHREHGHNNEEIENSLYLNWFHGGMKEVLDYPLASDYKASLCQSVNYEGGWVVRRTRIAGLSASVEVTKEGRSRFISAPLVVPENANTLSFEVGDRVLVNPFEAEEIHGFWHVFSPMWIANGLPEERQRIYFNVKRGMEREFVHTVCSLSSRSDCWSFKILCGRAEGPRHDVAVAYFPMSLDIQHGWFGDLLKAIAHLVDGEGPPVTKKLISGVYWAPDLSSSHSFGQVLCQRLMLLGKQNDVLEDTELWIEKSQQALLDVIEGET